MKFPPELLPEIKSVNLPNGVVEYTVSLTFGGQVHEYKCYELSDFAGMNIIMKAAEAGYGSNWEKITPVHIEDDGTIKQPAPAPAPVDGGKG